MQTHVYLSNSHNPWFNLATEDWLFQTAPLDHHILFLWRNQPCVVIGRAQNPWAECNLAQMVEDDILLARRQSGGGTVFHDLGNTNFTFISPLPAYDKNINLTLIINALKPFGVSAYASGRNDICVDVAPNEPRKFSGSAFRQTAEKAFHHGTLLFNANLEQLNHYLHPSKLKLQAKGVTSVRSRVINLTELNHNLNHDQFSQALIHLFFEHYQHVGKIEHLNETYLKQQPSLMKRYEEYKDWDWRFGKTLPFDLSLSHRFTWGEVTLELKFDQAAITHASVYSDCLYPDMINAFELKLPNTRCNGKALHDLALALQADFPQHADWLKELAQWLKQQLA